MKLLVQNQLQDVPLSVASSSHSPLNIISQLAHKMDDISHPQARACVLWLVGQYCPVEGENTVIDGVADWAPDVLRKAAKSFSSDVRPSFAFFFFFFLGGDLFLEGRRGNSSHLRRTARSDCRRSRSQPSYSYCVRPTPRWDSYANMFSLSADTTSTTTSAIGRAR